jgi:Mg2+-importing ATPase
MLAGVALTAAPAPFWTRGQDALCTELGCSMAGLSAAEAVSRLLQYGPNSDAPPRRIGVAAAVCRRLLEPLCLILLAAAIVSALTGDEIGGSIIVAILALSIGLDTFQEGPKRGKSTITDGCARRLKERAAPCSV